MKFSILLALAGTSFATLAPRRECHPNNCIRAINGTRLGASFQAQATSDCSRYASATITVTPAPVTVTSTSVPDPRRARRQDPGQPPLTVPKYADGKCTDVEQYASACSCIGITAAATTLEPVTVTVTVPPTASPTCDAGVDFQNDPLNCGTCGNVCGSGSCVDGSCVNLSCAQAECGSFNTCGSDEQNCFCFSNANDIGFCGQDAFCSDLAPCANDSECPTGSFICAVNTCCGAGGVCLETLCDNPARKLVKEALRVAAGRVRLNADRLNADTAAVRRRR